ncbi:MAG: hypothetical protein HY708_07910, partial [Ignavibacteriae bacterium]|nr:hypothetical protein [Ignavibacteriota bacterium]
MKQSSKERMAALLIDELLAQLSERESLKRMLGDMTSLPPDEVIEKLVADFEQVVEVYRQQSLEKAKSRRKPAEPVSPPAADTANSISAGGSTPPTQPTVSQTAAKVTLKSSIDTRETKAKIRPEEPSASIDTMKAPAASRSVESPRIKEKDFGLPTAEENLDFMRNEFEELERVVRANMEKNPEESHDSTEQYLQGGGTLEFHTDDSWLAERPAKPLTEPE